MKSSMHYRFLNSVVIIALVVAMSLFLIGCATGKKKSAGPVFFPPPPDEPHLQFLTSFDSEAALGGSGGFTEFVVGKDKAGKPIVKPYGMTPTPNWLYICDTQIGALEIVDLARKRMRYFTPEGQGQLGIPVNVAIDADGTRYITDTKRGQVVVFTAEDEYRGSIGAKDEMKPAGIGVSKDRIYVTDLKNHSVRIYNKADRKLLFSVPREGDDPRARMYSPTNLAIDKDGKVYVSDTGDFSVKVLDADGKYLKTIGQAGMAPGTLAFCKGVAVDREGRVYIVDAKTQVVQLFDKDGGLLMYFGDASSGGPGSTALPAGVAVDYDNVKHFAKFAVPNFKIEYLVYLVNQVGKHKISVFGFGQKK
jgi:DNA-binding beta-propeller fold protein YncE